MKPLPNFQPVGVKWIKKPKDFQLKEHPQSAQFPPIQKYKDYLVIDWCLHYPKIYKFLYRFHKNYYFYFGDNRGYYKLKIWKKEDHPNIKQLPEHTPRRVRRLYQAEYQLALLRGIDTYPDIYSAFEAWDKFNQQGTEGNVQMDKENVVNPVEQVDPVSAQMVEAQTLLEDGQTYGLNDKVIWDEACEKSKKESNLFYLPEDVGDNAEPVVN